MARSVTEITKSLQATLEAIDPSINLKVGPFFNYLLNPIPPELARLEGEQERILRFFSSDFPVVATPEEARSFALNFGLAANPGGRAFVPLVFFRNSPVAAGKTATVVVGTLVSTGDSSLLYRTVESQNMIGDYASTYFNSSTNKFEITVMVEAINPGLIYNVAPFRITKIASGQVPFDGVIQRNQANGGTEPETSFGLVRRVVNQFKGLNLGSESGMVNLTKNLNSESILDVHVIRPTDRLEFRRPAPGPALDLCVSGFEYVAFLEEYFALGGDTQIYLKDNRTAVSLVSVLVNSVALDPTEYSFQEDDTPEYRGSTRARPRVQLATALTANDIVQITGIKNNLLDKVQSYFTNQSDALFKTDILARSFVDLDIVVALEVKVKNSPTVDITKVQEALAALVAGFIETDTIPPVLEPDFLNLDIRSSIPEVDSVKMFQFRREISSYANVETVYPLKNEIPKFNATGSSLVVKI